MKKKIKKIKPRCVDCGKEPQLQYCRCWECLKEYEKRTHIINQINRVVIKWC